MKKTSEKKTEILRRDSNQRFYNPKQECQLLHHDIEYTSYKTESGKGLDVKSVSTRVSR
jgi:hypothetical protein